MAIINQQPFKKGQSVSVNIDGKTYQAKAVSDHSGGDAFVFKDESGSVGVVGNVSQSSQSQKTVHRTRGTKVKNYYPFKRFYTDLTSTMYKDGDGRGLVNLKYYGLNQAYALGGTNLGKDKFLALYFIQDYVYFVDRSQVYANLGNPDTIIYLGNEYCKNGNVNNYANTNYNYGISFPIEFNTIPNFLHEGHLRHNISVFVRSYDAFLSKKLQDNSNYLNDLYGFNFSNNVSTFTGTGFTDQNVNPNVLRYNVNSNLSATNVYPISFALLGKNVEINNGTLTIIENSVRTENFDFIRNPVAFTKSENYTSSESTYEQYNITLDIVFPDGTVTTINNTNRINTNINVTINYLNSVFLPSYYDYIYKSNLFSHQPLPVDLTGVTVTGVYHDPIFYEFANTGKRAFIYFNLASDKGEGFMKDTYECVEDIQLEYYLNNTYYDILYVFGNNTFLKLKHELTGTIVSSQNITHISEWLQFKHGINDPSRRPAWKFDNAGIFYNPSGPTFYTNNLTKGKVVATNNSPYLSIPDRSQFIFELTEIKIGTTDIFCDNDFFLIGRTPNVIDVNITNHSFDRFNQLYIGGQVSYYRLYQGLNEDWIINIDSFDGYFFADNKLCSATIMFTVRLEPENEAFYVDACNVEITNVLDTYCFLTNLGIFEPIDFGYYVEYYAGIFSKNSLFCLMRMAAETPNYQFKPNMNTAMIKGKPTWYFTDMNATSGQTKVDVYTVENNRIVRKPNIKDNLIKATKEPFMSSIAYHPTV